MRGPLLSIITPVFQGKATIAGCLETVIRQECDRLEHIIVDGASTDGTVEIVQDYMRRYPHIRLFSEKDRGQSDAINKGIQLARGKIIGILNADDYYAPGALNRALACFAGLPEPALVVANCNYRNEKEEVIAVNRPRRLRRSDLLLGWRVNPFPCNPAAYFYHRSLHEKIGYYDIRDHYAMDLDFLLKAVTAAHVRYVDEVWGNFRYVPGTKTFEDVKNGANALRVRTLLASYTDTLPFPERMRVKFLRGWFAFFKYGKTGYFFERLAYYGQDPRRLIRFFRPSRDSS